MLNYTVVQCVETHVVFSFMPLTCDWWEILGHCMQWMCVCVQECIGVCMCTCVVCSLFCLSPCLPPFLVTFNGAHFSINTPHILYMAHQLVVSLLSPPLPFLNLPLLCFNCVWTIWTCTYISEWTANDYWTTQTLQTSVGVSSKDTSPTPTITWPAPLPLIYLISSPLLTFIHLTPDECTPHLYLSLHFTLSLYLSLSFYLYTFNPSHCAPPLYTSPHTLTIL